MLRVGSGAPAALRALGGGLRGPDVHDTLLKDIHIYGRGISAVPRDWEPFMSTLENPLERNHKGPVGKV